MAAPVPRGPLTVRWHGLELGDVRAGAPTDAVVELENAGAVAWRSRGEAGVQLSYHWLDDLGNAIVYDGERTRLAEPVAPGERRRLPLRIRGPMPPGRYGLAVDLLEEFRFWFEDVGNAPLRREVEVAPRVPRRLAARGGDPRALAAQEEPLVDEVDAAAVARLPPSAAPARDWSRRVLDAHEEGFGVVGSAVEVAGGLLARRRRRELRPWEPGGGRRPRFRHPLLCASVAADAAVEWVDDVEGVPAARPGWAEPWVFDGRIVVRLAGRDPRR